MPLPRKKAGGPTSKKGRLVWKDLSFDWIKKKKADPEFVSEGKNPFWKVAGAMGASLSPGRRAREEKMAVLGGASLSFQGGETGEFGVGGGEGGIGGKMIQLRASERGAREEGGIDLMRDSLLLPRAEGGVKSSRRRVTGTRKICTRDTDLKKKRRA